MQTSAGDAKLLPGECSVLLTVLTGGGAHWDLLSMFSPFFGSSFLVYIFTHIYVHGIQYISLPLSDKTTEKSF